jgi:hypothetical protein
MEDFERIGMEQTIADLRFALRQAADQNGLLEVKISQWEASSLALTDEEREAIKEACDEGRWYPKDYHHIHTMRGLLERLK